jgi:hypothetical protein
MLWEKTCFIRCFTFPIYALTTVYRQHFLSVHTQAVRFEFSRIYVCVFGGKIIQEDLWILKQSLYLQPVSCSFIDGV